MSQTPAQARWYQENKERILADKKRQYHHRTPEEQVAHNETNRRWRDRNREKINAQHRKYMTDHPDIRAANQRNRRARYVGRITAQEWSDLCFRYGNKCLCCGATGVKLELDHVIPLALGGSHRLDNVQPLCSRCNRVKHTKIEDYRNVA